MALYDQDNTGYGTNPSYDNGVSNPVVTTVAQQNGSGQAKMFSAQPGNQANNTNYTNFNTLGIPATAPASTSQYPQVYNTLGIPDPGANNTGISMQDLSNLTKPSTPQFQPGGMSRAASALPQPPAKPQILVDQTPGAVQQPLPSTNAFAGIPSPAQQAVMYQPQGMNTYAGMATQGAGQQAQYLDGLTQQKVRMTELNNQTAALAQQAYAGNDWGQMLAARAQLAQLNKEKSQLTGSIAGIQSGQISSGQQANQANNAAFLQAQLLKDTTQQGFNNDVYKNLQQNQLGINTMAYMNANDPDRKQKEVNLSNLQEYTGALKDINYVMNNPELANTEKGQAILMAAQKKAQLFAGIPGVANFKPVQNLVKNNSTGIEVALNQEVNLTAQGIPTIPVQQALPTPKK